MLRVTGAAATEKHLPPVHTCPIQDILLRGVAEQLEGSSNHTHQYAYMHCHKKQAGAMVKTMVWSFTYPLDCRSVT